MNKLVTAGLISLILSASIAHSHETKSGWQYPNECCSNSDCDIIIEISPDLKTVTTKMHGVVYIPMSKWREIRPSGDNNWHLCASFEREPHIYCIFGQFGS